MGGNFSKALDAYNAARAVLPTSTKENEVSLMKDAEAKFIELVQAPSRDSADIAVKLELMAGEYDFSTLPEDLMATILADARRLAGQSDRPTWDALVQRLAVVEAALPTTDEQIDEAGQLIQQIMAMPAPDAGAARWKLDYVFDTSSGSNGCFDADFLEQLVADYRHFLGGSANVTTPPAAAYLARVNGGRSMSDLKMPARTPLMEMHKRYEETMAEYTRLELAENAARAEDTDCNDTPYRTAMKSSCRESEALRTAILHQAPTNA